MLFEKRKCNNPIFTFILWNGLCPTRLKLIEKLLIKLIKYENKMQYKQCNLFFHLLKTKLKMQFSNNLRMKLETACDLSFSTIKPAVEWSILLNKI